MTLNTAGNRESNTNRAILQANDIALADGLSHGDTNAATGLFNLYFERLFSMVFYSVGKDRETAEDITQDTFISALQAAKKYRGNSSVYTWLVGIANHKIADYYRRLTKERKYINNTFSPPTAEPQNFDDIVDRALETLPYQYRQVLILKYVEDMRVAEIAYVMNKTEKSVEALLMRGRKALKENVQTARDKTK